MLHHDLNFASQTKCRVYLPMLLFVKRLLSFCHVEFQGHMQRQQQMRLNKKINRLPIFMYNPRVHMRIIYLSNQARIQKVLPEGVQLWQRFFFLFFFWWGERLFKKHLKWAIIGPPAKRHLNSILLTGTDQWWPNIEFWLCSFVIFSGSGPVLRRNPIFLWFFRGESGPPAPLWIRAWATKFWYSGLFVKDSFIHGCTTIYSGPSLTSPVNI